MGRTTCLPSPPCLPRALGLPPPARSILLVDLAVLTDSFGHDMVDSGNRVSQACVCVTGVQACTNALFAAVLQDCDLRCGLHLHALKCMHACPFGVIFLAPASVIAAACGSGLPCGMPEHVMSWPCCRASCMHLRPLPIRCCCAQGALPARMRLISCECARVLERHSRPRMCTPWWPWDSNVAAM